MTRSAKPEPPCVLAKDTREPDPEAGDRPEALFRPWIFAPGQPKGTPLADREKVILPYQRGKLFAGDYSLVGLETVVAFERKSGPDLLGTLHGETEDSVGEALRAQDRFRAELKRAKDQRLDLSIVTEVSIGWLFKEAADRFQRYGKSYDPTQVLGRLLSYQTDYGVPTLWCGSKGMAEHVVGWTLARIWSQHVGGAAWKKAQKRGVGPLAWGFKGVEEAT